MQATSVSRGTFSTPMERHRDVVEEHHRFTDVQYKGEAWNLAHLDAFALRLDPGLGFEVDVVVLFSCHCFSQSLKRDGRSPSDIPADELFDNGRELRVLDEVRYRLSLEFLPRIVSELPHRQIQVAATERQNFVTFEECDEAGAAVFRYAVFFEIARDHRRKRRLLLHVQSAYALDGLTKRQKKAGKVSFSTLVRAAYARRKIRA